MPYGCTGIIAVSSSTSTRRDFLVPADPPTAVVERSLSVGVWRLLTRLALKPILDDCLRPIDKSFCKLLGLLSVFKHQHQQAVKGQSCVCRALHRLLQQPESEWFNSGSMLCLPGPPRQSARQRCGPMAALWLGCAMGFAMRVTTCLLAVLGGLHARTPISQCGDMRGAAACWHECRALQLLPWIS